MSTVIFDVSAMEQRLCRVDPDGDIVGYIGDCYGGTPAGVLQQINKLRNCDAEKFRELFPVSIELPDEEVAGFIMEHGAKFPQMDRLGKDPFDLLLLAYIQRNGSCMLVSCDKLMLYMAENLGFPHRCFKAALHDANIHMNNGIMEDSSYQTHEMHAEGSDPFFHYSNNRYCQQCDRKHHCSCHNP